MSNGSEGRKKSQFLADTAIPSNAFFDFVTGSTNRRISFANMLTAFGTTGTLEQVGAVSGTPVLNINGTVNQIRNLEAGAGVKAAVSPQNGITLSHSFVQDVTGSPVLVNPTSLTPVIASLEGVNGIAITSVALPSPHIEIGLSGTPVSVKTKVVNELSDFPTPVSSVITLADETEYLLTNDIDLSGNRLVFGDNCSLSGTDSVLITLSYSGSGDLFTMFDTLNRIHMMTIVAPSARIFNRTDTTTNIFRMTDITIASCDKIGIWTSVSGIGRFTNVSPTLVTTDGIEFVGNFRSILYESSAATMSAGALWNLGTATFDSFLTDTALATLSGSSNLLSGAASSANINTGGIGLIRAALTSGTGTPLSGITVDDALWTFAHNDDIADTRPDGLLSLQGNAIATVIAVAGTGVLVAGTWVVESVSQMTGTVAGRLTYDGGKDAKLPITASVTIEPVSGGSITVSACIAINGVAVPNSLRTSTSSAGNPTSITVPWQENLSTTDFVEVLVANEDTTVNLLVSSAVFRIN